MAMLSESRAVGRHDDSQGQLDGGDRHLARRRTILATAAIVAAYALLLLIRRPDGLVAPTIWAEDGRVFLADGFGPWQNLFAPYAGQLWPLQRLLGAAVSLLPPTWWPYLLYLISCAGAALAAATVLSERARPLLGSLRYRILAGAMLVLLPGVWEVQGNLANLHWWAAVAGMVLLATEAPRSVHGRALELTALVIISWSGLVGVLLLPVAVWRLLTRRNRYLVIRSAAVGVAAAVQVVMSFTISDRGGAADPVGSAPVFAMVVLKRIAGSLVVGESRLDYWWSAGGRLWLVAAASVALVAVVMILAVRDWRGPSWAWLATGFGCAALGTMSIPPDAARALLDPYFAGRYLLLAFAAIVLVTVRGLSMTTLRPVALTACILMVGGFLADASLPALAPPVPHDSLLRLDSCLDSSAPTPAPPFCYLATQPDTGDWHIVIADDDRR